MDDDGAPGEEPAAPVKVASDAGRPEGTGPGATGNGDPAAVPPEDTGVVEDPVEILVAMAERGEIDPWNINIIEVTDRFLLELEHRRQLNLQVSGRTLFFAATLLRLKSEKLEELSAEESGSDESDDGPGGEDYDLAFESEFGGDGRLGPIERLEREIQRRLDRKNLRKSPVTLFELIIELKNIEKEERRRRRLGPPEDQLIEPADIVGIAHSEDYLDSATTVYQECLKCVTREEGMTLQELCTKLGWPVTEVYIPLLFLMLEGHCALSQKEFFGDLYVQICRADEGAGRG